MECHKEDDHEDHAGGGIDGTDEEHHDSTPSNAQYTGVPGEILESGPAEKA